MTNIKAAFFDIDGTLIEHSVGLDEPRPSTIKALNAMREAGIKVVVASGRTPQSVGHITDFAFDGFISANGALDFADGKQIYKGGLTQEEARTLRDYLFENKVGFIMQGDALFLYGDLEDYGVDHYLQNVRKRSYEKRIEPVGHGEIHDLIFKATVFFDSIKKKEKTQKDLKGIFHSMINEANTGSGVADKFNGEISSIRDTKGSGIQHLLDYWKIDPKDAIAFGDNSNDLEMFDVVDGYAMGNSVDELKAKAVEVIGDVNSDAIAELLIKKRIISR
jgi:Cof subfamily protein (haloacid dehalogenase superfamily)